MLSDFGCHVLGGRLKVAISIKYDVRLFWVREMLLHICQITSDNIPVGSSFLPRKGVEEQTSIKTILSFAGFAPLTVVSFREFTRSALVTVLKVPLSLNIEQRGWEMGKIESKCFLHLCLSAD